MANKISSNFSDLIQRVAASCLLHPLSLFRQEFGNNFTEDEEELYEYETYESDELPKEEEDDDDEEMVEKDGKLEGCNKNVKSRMVVPMERVMEMEMLMYEVFDSVSVMKRAYTSLQEAHCPWDPKRIRVADVAVVGELRRLAFFMERFRRCVSAGSAGGWRRGGGDDFGMELLREVVAPYEAVVEELKKEAKTRDLGKIWIPRVLRILIRVFLARILTNPHRQ